MKTENLDLLRESLPYIQRFKGKTFVVKFSGSRRKKDQGLESEATEFLFPTDAGKESGHYRCRF